jgi:hypothetical protein
MKIKITDEARGAVTCKQEVLEALISGFVLEHRIHRSSFANLSLIDGKLIIATSQGSLEVNRAMTEASKPDLNKKMLGSGRHNALHRRW